MIKSYYAFPLSISLLIYYTSIVLSTLLSTLLHCPFSSSVHAVIYIPAILQDHMDSIWTAGRHLKTR